MFQTADEPRHLLHIFSTFAVGGPQRRFVQLANILGAKYRHSILAMDGNFAATKGLNDDVHHACETIPVRKNGAISLANLLNARRLLRRTTPDLLVTYNWGAIEWVIANRWPTLCPHLHLEDGFGPEESPGRQLWRRAKTRHLLLAQCDRVVVPSLVLKDVATQAWQLSPDKVEYLPNGIDCDRFLSPPDEQLIAALGISEDALVVGTVAALRQEKNLPRLVRAFAALPPDIDARLLIVGEGPDRAAIEEAGANLDVSARVVFAGSLRQPERLIRRFDVFALSSNTEQMPYSVLEAMAAERPVVSTDVGDIKRMVAPENAEFVVPIEDEKRLTHRMSQLLRDRSLRIKIGTANRRRVQVEYSLTHMVERYDNLFSTL